MRVCPSCGAVADPSARFCSRCGTALDPGPPSERRALVSVLFCDLVGSTKLGERVDPELLREIQTQYFAACSRVLERHGGQVEKFIGDAVLCLFGAPRAHEDDALRACRAALDLLAAVDGLNAQFPADWSVTLEVRVGVYTGEVVVGDPSRGQVLATGDAVNTAARLEQAANAGEILIGEPTYRLVEARVDADAVAPVVAKGKSEPLAAFRLRALRAGRADDRDRALFVGRGRELAELVAAFEAAAESNRLVGALVVGDAGMGKSRLVDELVRTVGDRARTLTGSCLSYGEGITFWPLRELVEQTSAERPIADIVGGDLGEAVEERLLRAVGLREGPVSREQLFGAAARLLAALAAVEPLVVVLEDLHWAEPLLLDLVDFLVSGLASSRLLLVATARPELTRVESPPRLRELRLAPLDPDDADALAVQRGVPAGDREALLRLAAGNPLFIQQLSASAATPAGAALPPDLRALLAARLDALESAEREVVDAAAVIGREFWVQAVAALLPDRSAVDIALVLRKLELVELVEQRRSSDAFGSSGLSGVFASADRWAFRHALIHDAAYAALAKARASRLHEAFAGFLEQSADTHGIEAIVAWHLEQAVRLRGELRPREARQAVSRLESAAQRALERGDAPAAENLLSRAAALRETPDVAGVDSLQPGERLGGYVVEGVAGRGGMGVVYRARDPRLGRTVALKVISPALAGDAAFRERFKRESLIAGQMEHPNVVPVYTAGEDGARLFIAMRYVEGTDLASLIADEGRLDVASAAAIVVQVGHALDAAHARGLVHRDVKPANVLLSPDENGGLRAYLTDFGLSVEGGGGGALTRTGQWVGTLAYVAPEQVRGADVDCRTDVYALGGLLHHCLTGQVPYPREHELDALSAHLSEPPPRPTAVVPTLPTAFDSVVARAMSKDPQARYPSAGALGGAALAAAVGSQRRLPAAATRVARRIASAARPRRLGILASVLVAVIATVVAVLATRGGQPKAAAQHAAVFHVQQSPDRLTVLGSRVWGVASGGGRLVRIDPAAHAVRSFASPVDLGGGSYPDVAAGFGSVWLAHGNATVGGVDRLDPVHVQAIEHIPLPAVAAVAVGSRVVWAVAGAGAARKHGIVAMIDPRTNRIVRSLTVGRSPVAVAEGAGGVWIADQRTDSVYRVDLHGTRVVATIPVGAGPARVAVTASGVWVANLTDRTLSRIDPRTNRVLGAPVSLGKDIEDISGDGKTLWVASADSTVVGLDARDGRISVPPITVGRPPLALAVGAGGVWVGSGGDETIARVAAGS